MKLLLQLTGQSGAATAARAKCFGPLWSGLLLGALLSAQELHASSSIAELSALPETNAAANFVATLTSSAVPEFDRSNYKSRAVVSLIEAGFLIGTTTAVHELGHARQVRALGGKSSWETGDVSWCSYVTHRVPLAAGSTKWQMTRNASVDERIMIATGGFNATTAWDEYEAGHGSFGLVTARYSTLLYVFSGVGSLDDDLSQIENLYAQRGYGITRREMQVWQLLAGLVTQTNSSVRTYAYFTPSGVSVKAVTHWDDWSVAAEVVVHGASDAEVELGRRLRLGNHVEVHPQVLISQHGVGGSLKAGVRIRDTIISLNCQWVNAATLLGARTNTNFDLAITTRL